MLEDRPLLSKTEIKGLNIRIRVCKNMVGCGRVKVKKIEVARSGKQSLKISVWSKTLKWLDHKSYLGMRKEDMNCVTYGFQNFPRIIIPSNFFLPNLTWILLIAKF